VFLFPFLPLYYGTISYSPLSAEGDATKFPIVVDAAIAQKPSVIITVGTQITNTILGIKYADRRPAVIASAIYEPEKLQIPKGQIVTIISDNPSGGKDAIAYMVSKITATVKKAGLLVNNNEVNSVASARQVEKVFKAINIGCEYGYISTPADIIPVVKGMIRNGVELIIIPHDKIAVANAGVVVKLGMSNKPNPIPVFSLDDGTVKKDGVLFAVSADYSAIGEISAKEALQLLKNKSYMPRIIYPEKIIIVVNKNVARNFGMDLSNLSLHPNNKFNIILIDK
jgi:ABC-type uncharacterized transport system substrate-binding protein